MSMGNGGSAVSVKLPSGWVKTLVEGSARGGTRAPAMGFAVPVSRTKPEMSACAAMAQTVTTAKTRIARARGEYLGTAMASGPGLVVRIIDEARRRRQWCGAG